MEALERARRQSAVIAEVAFGSRDLPQLRAQMLEPLRQAVYFESAAVYAVSPRPGDPLTTWNKDPSCVERFRASREAYV